MDTQIAQALLRRHLMMNVPKQHISHHVEEKVRNTAADIGVMISAECMMMIEVIRGDGKLDETRASFQTLIDALVRDGASVKQHVKFHGAQIDEICHIIIDGEEMQLWLTSY